MEWEIAINKSTKGSATRVKEINGIKRQTIKYRDGSGYMVVSSNGKVDYFLSRPANQFELNGFDDWQPS